MRATVYSLILPSGLNKSLNLHTNDFSVVIPILYFEIVLSTLQALWHKASIESA